MCWNFKKSTNFFFHFRFFKIKKKNSCSELQIIFFQIKKKPPEIFLNQFLITNPFCIAASTVPSTSFASTSITSSASSFISRFINGEISSSVFRFLEDSGVFSWILEQVEDAGADDVASSRWCSVSSEVTVAVVAVEEEQSVSDGTCEHFGHTCCRSGTIDRVRPYFWTWKEME